MFLINILYFVICGEQVFFCSRKKLINFIFFNTTVQRNYPIGSVDLNRNHSSDVLV